jgi:hypothetical protein
VAANAGLISATAAGGGAPGSGVSSSVSLTDLALLRRELGQAEGLLQAYQAENKAAARRIKVGRVLCWGLWESLHLRIFCMLCDALLGLLLQAAEHLRFMYCTLGIRTHGACAAAGA